MSTSAPLAEPSAAVFQTALFRKTLVYTRKATIDELQRDLYQLSQLDLESQKQAKHYGFLAGMAGIGFVVGIIATIASVINNIPVAPLLTGSFVLASIAAGIFFLINYWHHRGTDVENRRYELASSLLRYLATDIRPATEVELKIDFHSYYDRKYITQKVGTSSTYQLPWLTVKGKFADGNRFDFSAEMKVKRKEKPKRKYTKVKEDISEDLTLEVTPRNPPEDSPLMHHLATIPPPPLNNYRAQVHAGKLTLRAMTSKYRKLTGRSGTTDQSLRPVNMTELDQFLRLFLTAYHCLNTFPSKAA